MINYKQRIDTYTGVILKAIECEQSIQLILDSSIAYDVAKELYYMNKSKFEYYTEDMFDELLAENDILSVCVLNSSDGKVRLFLQEVFDVEGNTMEDEDSDFILIEENLLDCVDIKAFECIVGVICEENQASYESDDEDIDDLLEELTEEVISEIREDERCVHCIIKEKLQEAYEIGVGDFFRK
jgi:hypothetical protein